MLASFGRSAGQLHPLGLERHDVVLVDSNADLIGCYETVRDAPDAVARALDRLAAAHARDGRTQYYAVRDSQFNPLRARLRQPDGRIVYTPQLAAMLIYLNRTGFNGLFRLNASGAFNVPAGRYNRPKIVDRDRLLRVTDALSFTGVVLGIQQTAVNPPRAAARVPVSIVSDISPPGSRRWQ